MNRSTIDPERFRALSAPASRLRERLSAEELRHHLDALEKVTNVALARLPLPDLVSRVTTELGRTFAVDHVTILRLGNPSSPIDPSSETDQIADESATRANPAVDRDGDFVAAVARHPRVLAVDELPEAGRPPELEGVSSAIVAPLQAAGETIGLLVIGSGRPRRFEEAELLLAETIAPRVAIGIRDAELAERAQEQDRERDRVERELAESEGRYRLLAETAADSIITINEDSQIVSANPAAGDAFGYSVEELIGKPLTDLIPHRYRKAHKRGIGRYIETGERRLPWRGLELPGLRRDGSEVLFDVSFNELAMEGARFFTGTMRDITERKRTERILAAQFATTRVLAEASSIEPAIPAILEGIGRALGWEAGVFWRWDEENHQLRSERTWTAPEIAASDFVDASADRAFSPGMGLPGKVWKDRVPQWIADVAAAPNFPRMAAAAAAGLHSAFAFPMCAGDDCIGVMEFYAAELRTPDDQLLESMGALGADIAQFMRRREAEHRLERQERLQRYFAELSTSLAASALDFEATLRKLASLAVPVLGDGCAVQVMPDEGDAARMEVATILPDGDADLRRIAIALRDRLGTGRQHRRDPAEPLLISDLPAEVAANAAFAPIAEVVARTGAHSLLVVRLMARGRSLGTVSLFATDAGRQFGWRDVAAAEEFANRAALALDNARLYRESRKANRAKAEFLATISHELRTPLNAVIGYSELLKMGIADQDPAKSRDYIDRINVAAVHLSQLIEEVLAFSRIESGREVVTAASTELHQILDEVKLVVEPLASEKHLAFVVDAPEGQIEMITDSRKVRQILLNLIGNAIKFTDEGKVMLRVEIAGDEAILEVSDTGIGIDSKKIDHVFEPFWQVEQGTTRTVGGTGLGLTVTKRFAELLGGEVHLESEIGRGTTVRVAIPLRYETEAHSVVHGEATILEEAS